MHAAMHTGAYINQSLRSFDQRRQNVGRKHIDGEDARNSGLHLHPALAITDACIVDYSVEGAEPVHLLGHCSCPSDGREVSGDNSPGARCCREGVATSTLVSPVQLEEIKRIPFHIGEQPTCPSNSCLTAISNN